MTYGHRGTMRDYEAIKRSTEQQAAAREFFIREHFPVGGVGAEIGVLYGQFSERILKIARPRMLYLVDPWDHDDRYGDRTPEMMEAIYRGTLEKFINEKSARALRMDSLAFWLLYRNEIAHYGEPALDFVYIDGSHEKEDIVGDINRAWDLVKPGGIIAGDDCSYTRYWKNNVEEAVTEFCQAKGIPWQRFPVHGHTDQFLIRR